MILVLVDKSLTSKNSKKTPISSTKVPSVNFWLIELWSISSSVEKVDNYTSPVNTESLSAQMRTLWNARPQHLLFHSSQWVMRTGWRCGLWYVACSILAYLVEEVNGIHLEFKFSQNRLSWASKDCKYRNDSLEYVPAFLTIGLEKFLLTYVHYRWGQLYVHFRNLSTFLHLPKPLWMK